MSSTHCEVNGQLAYVERTGFKPGDRIKQWVCRCYLNGGGGPLVFAYGDDREGAMAALSKKLIEREAALKGTEL